MEARTYKNSESKRFIQIRFAEEGSTCDRISNHRNATHCWKQILSFRIVQFFSCTPTMQHVFKTLHCNRIKLSLMQQNELTSAFINDHAGFLTKMTNILWYFTFTVKWAVLTWCHINDYLNNLQYHTSQSFASSSSTSPSSSSFTAFIIYFMAMK